MTIIVPYGSFYIGQTCLTLTCVISLNSITAIESDVFEPEDLDIMWLRGGTTLIHNDIQVTISNTSSFKQQYMSNLTLAPLSFMDTKFICRARVVHTSGPDFIVESEAGQFVATITIQCKLATTHNWADLKVNAHNM